MPNRTFSTQRSAKHAQHSRAPIRATLACLSQLHHKNNTFSAAHCCWDSISLKEQKSTAAVCCSISWELAQPQKRAEWGWLPIGIRNTAKIALTTSHIPKYSWSSGCSTLAMHKSPSEQLSFQKKCQNSYDSQLFCLSPWIFGGKSARDRNCWRYFPQGNMTTEFQKYCCNPAFHLFRGKIQLWFRLLSYAQPLEIRQPVFESHRGQRFKNTIESIPRYYWDLHGNTVEIQPTVNIGGRRIWSQQTSTHVRILLTS